MEDSLNQIRNRPRFLVLSSDTPAEVQQRLKDYVKLHKDDISANINAEVSVLSVRTPVDYFWKPYLNLRSETECNGTAIRGVYGPSAAIWTLFMFGYFIFGIGLMVCLTIWLVTRQIGNDEYGWALPVAIFCLIGLVAVYLAAKFGQKKASGEMQRLRQVVEDVFKKDC